MCGICGFNWEDKNLVKNMAYVISHRGPDQDGYYIDKNISLGHKRLSIIDLSENGRQPMFNEDGSICIVYNGEIYNFQEIKPELEKKGHRFISDTDTEVVIHAYEEYGFDCLKLFDGMFAFAIWDSSKKILFMARDRLGKKFLYYYYKDGKFLFASEVKSLLQYEGIKKKLNKSTLSQFIIWAYSIDGSTFFEDVNALKPGHYMIYDGRSIKIKKYWDLQDKLRTIKSPKSESYYIKKLRTLLIEAVEKRLISDVPLGVSLSGGLDSSIIVGIMNYLKCENIKTFTIGFGREDDEFSYAKLVADHCKAEYKEIRFSNDTVIKNIPPVLWAMEVPSGRPTLPALYALFKEIKSDVTVNLVGEGSDEFFAGYNRYHVYAPMPKYSKIYEQNEFNRAWWQEFEKYKNMDIKEKIDLITSGYFKDEDEKKSTFIDETLSKLPNHCTVENSFGKLLRQSDKSNYLNNALCFECKTSSLLGLHITKLDKLPMASSLEVRVPFLDHQIAEFSLEIPPILKWNGLDKKYIIQRIATEFVPKEIAFRRKLPMHFSLLDCYKDGFFDAIQVLLSDKSVAKRDYLKKAGHIAKLLNKFKTNPNTMDENSLRQMLFLTNLELMQRMFFENDNLRNPSMDINRYLD